MTDTYQKLSGADTPLSVSQFPHGSLAGNRLGYSCRREKQLLTVKQMREEMVRLQAEAPGWEFVHDARIWKLKLVRNFPDFKTASAWANEAGVVAERWGHHPEIRFTWGKAEVLYHTIKYRGLTKDDFIMAARTSYLLSNQPQSPGVVPS